MAQLARRNILVTDVEIYEYEKKKISYKEEEDGIKVKNRKFRFDDGASVVLDEEKINGNGQNGDQDFSKLLQDPQILEKLKGLLNNSQQPQPHQQLQQQKKPQNQHPIRYEIFDPVDQKTLLPIAKQRGWAFTLGNKYAIFEEKIGPNVTDGMLYTVIDDKGQRRIVSDKFFVPVQVRLTGDFVDDRMDHNVVGIQNTNAPKLSWDGAIDEDMPSLRGR